MSYQSATMLPSLAQATPQLLILVYISMSSRTGYNFISITTSCLSKIVEAVTETLIVRTAKCARIQYKVLRRITQGIIPAGLIIK